MHTVNILPDDIIRIESPDIKSGFLELSQSDVAAIADEYRVRCIMDDVEAQLKADSESLPSQAEIRKIAQQVFAEESKFYMMTDDYWDIVREAIENVLQPDYLKNRNT